MLFLLVNMFHDMIHFQEILEDLPVLGNVRQLELRIRHRCGGQLDRTVSLLSSFPSISVLKIKVKNDKISLSISTIYIFLLRFLRPSPNMFKQF